MIAWASSRIPERLWKGSSRRAEDTEILLDPKTVSSIILGQGGRYGQACANRDTHRANWQYPKTCGFDRPSRKGRRGLSSDVLLRSTRTLKLQKKCGTDRPSPGRITAGVTRTVYF